MKSPDEQFGSSVLPPSDGEAGEWAIGTLPCAVGASAPRAEIIPLSNSPNKDNKARAVETAERVDAPVAKPSTLSLIPGSYIVEGEHKSCPLIWSHPQQNR